MSALVLGIDLGTSGVRAVAMDEHFDIAAEAATALAAHGAELRDPEVWWRATAAVVAEVLGAVGPERIRALAVDGTSGTVLPVDGEGRPLGLARMYHDATADQGILDAVARAAPATSAAHGATSALAKVVALQDAAGVARVLHQADWIAGRFSGCFDVSDENNALKTGYDPVARAWPDWIAAAGARRERLPEVVAPGSPVGQVTRACAGQLGLAREVVVVAGTTDGCASFLATGAGEIGDGVTALGTSLTLKLLCAEPIFAPAYGLYSHRMGERWLAGGASNTGGRVLAEHFDPERIAELCATIDPQTPGRLDYYPLVGKGERFPIADPEMAPRMTPQPEDEAEFLKEILWGIAGVEALAYERLQALGGPKLGSLRTVGRGARNTVWTRMRAGRLGVTFRAAMSEEAAAGTARLALEGARAAGVL